MQRRRYNTHHAKITPNLWFNGTAKEAAEFYTAIFPGGKISGKSYYPKTAEEGLADFQQNLAGKELTVAFEIAGHAFTAINAGPEFTPTPANSFFVYFDPRKDSEARAHLDQVWQKLSAGGEVLMPLQAYPFSDYYGWAQDKYGFSWQLITLVPQVEDFPCIVPDLLFAGDVQNRAGEAIDFYTSVFKNSRRGYVDHYQEPTGPATTDSISYGDFELDGVWFAAMDSGVEQSARFTEAVSYVVICKDQAEIDYFWEKLSSVPEAEQCGWCKDRFGVSWQIVPANMEELMARPGAFARLMPMKKLIIGDF